MDLDEINGSFRIAGETAGNWWYVVCDSTKMETKIFEVVQTLTYFTSLLK